MYLEDIITLYPEEERFFFEPIHDDINNKSCLRRNYKNILLSILMSGYLILFLFYLFKDQYKLLK